MYDLHHHLLPALDDGSPDLATSLEMARIAVADGITHVVCTPHASTRYSFDPELVRSKAEELKAALTEAQIPLRIGLGCDFHLSYDNVQDAFENRSRYTINAGDYLLVELPDYSLAPNLKETFYDLRLGGFIPILTHPERNPTLQRDPQRLLPWLRDGMLMQVTAGSVLGHMGKEAKRLAEKMLANRWVHFIATDAHDTKRRPPKMREAYDIISRKYGTAYADLICTDNPRDVFNGEPLGEQEEGHDLYDPNPFKERWWERLWKM